MRIALLRTLLIVSFIPAVAEAAAAQCADGRPCVLRLSPRPRPNRRGPRPPVVRPPVDTTIAGTFPTANPPSHGAHPFPGRQPGLEYVNLNITIRDQRRRPWTEAEVGISDGMSWVGNSTGFKFLPVDGPTFNGKTQFTDVPCGRRLRLAVFYEMRGLPLQTSPYDFTLTCRRGTREMFFVLNR